MGVWLQDLPQGQHRDRRAQHDTALTHSRPSEHRMEGKQKKRIVAPVLPVAVRGGVHGHERGGPWA